MDLSCFFSIHKVWKKGNNFLLSHFTDSSLLQLHTHLSHQRKTVYEFRFMQLSLLSGLKCCRELIWKAIGIKWNLTMFMALQWLNFSQQHPDMSKCSWCYVIVSFSYCGQTLLGVRVLSKCKLKIQEVLHTEVRDAYVPGFSLRN